MKDEVVRLSQLKETLDAANLNYIVHELTIRSETGYLVRVQEIPLAEQYGAFFGQIQGFRTRKVRHWSISWTDTSITTRLRITTRFRLLLRDFKVYTHGRAIDKEGDRHEPENQTHKALRRAQAACQRAQTVEQHKRTRCDYECG